jgi:hypothetical protein
MNGALFVLFNPAHQRSCDHAIEAISVLNLNVKFHRLLHQGFLGRLRYDGSTAL